jgi:AcrR family transcriptional regulator
MKDSSSRQRNKRGEGSKLREEILQAATKLLEETGSEESVTLRAIAREIGVAAPSIYGHFDSRESIVDTVIDQAFEDFFAAVLQSTQNVGDPVERLRKSGVAYLEFADEFPQRYAILFDRREHIEHSRTEFHSREAAFNALVALVQACIDSGQSSSDDASKDSVAIWAALHGLAMLRANMKFDWPDINDTLDRILNGVAHIN